MAACEPYLQKLVSHIQPTPTQKKGAKRSHHHLRDLLCSGQMGARITDHYLSGSYSRNTAIYPLDDVDIIFIIDPAAWKRPFNVVSTLLFGYVSKPDPLDVLKSFKNAIRYRYPNSSVRLQRRSVRLRLFHLDIDVVPAIEHTHRNEIIYIPDSEAGNWIPSSPITHSDLATAINKNNDGRFKPLVKLLKYWNYNLPSTAQLKSFAIETIAVRLFQNTSIPSLQEGLAIFFDFITYVSNRPTEYEWTSTYGISLCWYSDEIPDTAKTGSNIISGISGENRNRFLENAIRSRDLLVKSLDSSSDLAARRLISKVFRVEFKEQST